MIDLRDIPAIDQHAHNLLHPAAVARLPYPDAFTEGYDPDIVSDHARYSLFYRRSLRDIAELLECEPDEAVIFAQRAQLDLEQLSRRCFEAANLETIFLDDGFLAADILPTAWHQQFVPVRRLLRLEYLAEILLGELNDFDAFLEGFSSAIDPPPPDVVALKSIVAYRTGLDVQLTPKAVAESRFYALKQQAAGCSQRLTDKPLLDFLLTQALEIASKHRLPVQFHTTATEAELIAVAILSGNARTLHSLV